MDESTTRDVIAEVIRRETNVPADQISHLLDEIELALAFANQVIVPITGPEEFEQDPS